MGAHNRSPKAVMAIVSSSADLVICGKLVSTGRYQGVKRDHAQAVRQSPVG